MVRRKYYCILDDYDWNINNFENLIEIRFIINGQSFYIPCRREDNFSKVEEKVFEEFPELRYKNIKFLNNSNEINRSSTLIENNINSDISVMIIDEN